MAAPGAWPPITIGERHWIDRGVRSPANADLAAGYQRVVVIALITRGFQSSLSSQASALTAGGTSVAVIEPDTAAARFIGRKGLDPALRAPAARAGYAQAPYEADRVAAVWTG